MHELRNLSRAIAATSLAFGCASANALVTYIDEFKVVRSNNSGVVVNFFTDLFEDNLAPPKVPVGSFDCNAPAATPTNCYTASGTFADADEFGGKLRLNSANGVATVSSLGDARVLLSARLLSNRSDAAADINTGLKIHRIFSASAVYDLVLPSPGELMQVRFNDAHLDPLEAGHRTDYLALGVRRATDPGAQPEIRFFEQNFAAGTLVQIDATPLNTALGADQIRLTLSHPVSGSTEVFASWEYLKLGAKIGEGSFATPGNIFDGETWTRAEFGVSAVPEPQTYALMLIGVGLIGWQLRRHTRRGLLPA